MPGTTEVIDIMAYGNNENLLMMKSKANLYSSQGVLTGILTLFRNRLMWSEISNRSANMLTISMDVLFGATLSPPGKFKFKSIEAASATNLSIESSTHFTVYTIMARESGKRPLCDTWSFEVESEEESAMWVSLLRSAIRPSIAENEDNVLVFLNPVSGKRLATKVFDTIVKPIFNIGHTRYTLKITESQGYATDFVEKEDLSSYTSIIVISGDGLLHEVLNGFLRRADWPKYKALPLGVIPAGTGNGLAKSLDSIWPEQAAVAVVKGESRPLDIMSATLASGKTKYCFLSLTWGLLADIDIESETMRWAGAARLDIYGTVRVMNLRYYGGRLHYLPAIETEDAEGDGSATPKPSGPRGLVQGGSANSSIFNLLERTNQGLDDAWGLPPPSFSSPLVRHSPKLLPSQLAPNIQPAVTLHSTLTAGIQLPVTASSLPPRWKTIEGPFVQVIAANVPWLGADFLASEHTRVSDGNIDLIFSRNVSKWQMIPYMSSSTKGNYMNKGGIEHIKARAFILEPTGLRTTSRSDSSLRAIQSINSAGVSSANEGVAHTISSHRNSSGSSGSIRPLSVPGFNSLRIKSISKAVGRGTRSSSLQTPVPARVRSEAYTSYHQQSTGRNGSVPVQGTSLSPSPSTTKFPDTLAGAVKSENTAESAAQNSSLEDSALRTPVQAAFSLRSETEMASLTIDEVAAVSGGGALGESQTENKPVALETSGSEGCRLVGQHGIIALDGEQEELGTVKVECLANLISVICPPWLDLGCPTGDNAAQASKVFEPIKGSLSREGSVLSFSNI